MQEENKDTTMKKITLLFTLLCAGALNGMEVPEHGHYVGIGIEALPDDVKPLIIMYLNEYDDVDDIVTAIKATSLSNKELNKIVNEMYGNQKGFAALAHMLANKFNTTTEVVAEEFGTPAAKHYLDLGNQLNTAISSGKFNIAKKLIEKGADVNYPAEIIISILKNYTADDAIKDLKKRSVTNLALHKMINEKYGDQKGFAVLVHALNTLFKVDVEDLYHKLNTPAIRSYDNLGESLVKAVKSNNFNAVTQLIKQHADVNYDVGPIDFLSYNTNIPMYKNVTPFDLAVLLENTEIAELLLNAGAIPKPDNYYISFPYNPNTGFFPSDEDIEEMNEYKTDKEMLNKLPKK